MNFIKSSLIFAAGASAGAGVVYFIMNRKLKAERESVDRAVEEVKAAYSNSEKNQELKKEYDFTVQEVDPHSWTSSTTPATISISNHDYAVDTIEKLADKIDSKLGISLISAEEFDENGEDAHVFLTYYKLDNEVVYSDTLIPMEHPEEYLGEYFRDEFEDSDVVYIQNDNEGELYEVLINEVNSLSDKVDEDGVETHNIFDSEGGTVAEGGD